MIAYSLLFFLHQYYFCFLYSDLLFFLCMIIRRMSSTQETQTEPFTHGGNASPPSDRCGNCYRRLLCKSCSQPWTSFIVDTAISDTESQDPTWRGNAADQSPDDYRPSESAVDLEMHAAADTSMDTSFTQLAYRRSTSSSPIEAIAASTPKKELEADSSKTSSESTGLPVSPSVEISTAPPNLIARPTPVLPLVSSPLIADEEKVPSSVYSASVLVAPSTPSTPAVASQQDQCASTIKEEVKDQPSSGSTDTTAASSHSLKEDEDSESNSSDGEKEEEKSSSSTLQNVIYRKKKRRKDNSSDSDDEWEVNVDQRRKRERKRFSDLSTTSHTGDTDPDLRLEMEDFMTMKMKSTPASVALQRVRNKNTSLLVNLQRSIIQRKLQNTDQCVAQGTRSGRNKLPSVLQHPRRSKSTKKSTTDNKK